VTISVNEQVTGHKVTVRPAALADRGQRHAGCQCGWQSRIGSTEQVMPEIRTHLEAALAATQPPTETVDQAWLQDLRALRPVSPGPRAEGVALRS
jgi:predicted small metal-binding protein